MHLLQGCGLLRFLQTHEKRSVQASPATPDADCLAIVPASAEQATGTKARVTSKSHQPVSPESALIAYFRKHDKSSEVEQSDLEVVAHFLTASK